MTVLLILSTLALGLGIYIAWRVHGNGRMQVVVEPHTGSAAQPFPENPPLISVIIPARDEQRNIQRCLEALFLQTYPNFEILVVEDRSTDQTPQILTALAQKEPRLHVLQGNDLPAGWAGKPHALVQGAAAARGEWLCFMDADTFANPDLLTATYLQAVKRRADMLSILTEQELGSFWERAILPLVFMGLAFGFPAERVNDPSKPDAIANGQFILIQRRVYEQVGGHTAVKDHIDEDRAFAAVVKQQGYRLILADGRKVASTRMYVSLAEMWEGWTKNIYLGLRDRLLLLLFGALLGLLVSLALPAWLIGGLAWLARGGALPAFIVTLEAGALWGYLLWKRWKACRWFGIPGGYAFTFPLGALLFTAMMMGSAFYVISGRGVIWKGRRYH